MDSMGCLCRGGLSQGIAHGAPGPPHTFTWNRAGCVRCRYVGFLSHSPWLCVRIHDLTAEVSTHMPVWPTNPLPVIEPVGITSRDGYAIERISAMTHTGTHIDAPYHFIDGGGATVDAIPVERLVSRGFCIRPGVRGGEEISRADLERVWDRRFRGSAILIDTGWSRRRAFTKEFLYGFPGLSEDAADFLLSQEVGMVGIDTLGIEPYSHHGFEVHKRLLSAGVS